MNYSTKTLLFELDALVESDEIHKHTKRITEIIKLLPEQLRDKVKEAVVYDSGWLFCGADFASLEDRISALQSKDTNKLKVYTDGFDGHCLRAYSYFSESMPDIDPSSVDSINSIKDLYPDLRQLSKEPTFLLTYDGTWHGLVHNSGFTPEKAKMIESRFHDLYKESAQWKMGIIDQATKDGYVTVAFGLRVRTPVLSQTILNTSKTPYEARKEARSAGNALGQSYCMLTNRAGIEVQEIILESKYSEEILPSCHIHDAQYFLAKNTAKHIHFLNTHLVKAMEWQELPEIMHPQVKLGGELSVFYPSWAKEIHIPKNASIEEITNIARGNKP